MKTLCLIDGDIILYKAAFGTQKKIDGKVVLSPLNHALSIAHLLLKKILTRCETTYYELYIGDQLPSNFRYKLAKTPGYKGLGYKLGRPPKPDHFSDLRCYLQDYLGASVVCGIETDDMLAIRQTECMAIGQDSIIASIDKDLLQVPGQHYNFFKETFKIVSELEGWRNLYTQVLTGDNADNIPGIPKVGPVTAKKILKDCKTKQEIHDTVVNEYDKRKLTYFEEVYSLCYLLRARPESS